ncbi:MAG: sugar phosphate isomerase/epimerase [Candidatus Pacebacteria bacterium]|nr:sugar phosphate isomerase/epimerase [Candidatus Paceibacterota bacterium]
MGYENEQVIVENREKIKIRHSKLGLASYINPRTVCSQKEHDQQWQALLDNWHYLECLEIQYEHDYRNNWWQSLPAMLQHYAGKIIVHGPTQKRDLASIDQQLNLQSLTENKLALDFATQIGAESMILHITPRNDFNSRLKQLDRAMLSATELAQYIKDNNLPVALMLENLEYPKWPADAKEAVDLLKDLKNIHPNLCSCLDLPHLWHNHAALIPGLKYSDDDFIENLINYIVEVDSIAPIQRFHFAGAYVDRANNIHETHGVPDLNNHHSSAKQIVKMPVTQCLNIMDEFINDQIDRGIKAADIILEMHVGCQEQERALKNIQNYLRK